MRNQRAEVAQQIVDWASRTCGPYADAHKNNMRVELIKSGANLLALMKLQPRERMHDINIILSGGKDKLFCGPTH